MVRSISMVAVLLVVTSVACRAEQWDTWETAVAEVPASEMLLVDAYVECVNSRFPLFANRYAYVNRNRVAEEIQEGRLDLDGMETTYRNLGCGELAEAKGG